MSKPMSEERWKELDSIYRKSTSPWSYDIRELLDAVRLLQPDAYQEIRAAMLRASLEKP